MRTKFKGDEWGKFKNSFFNAVGGECVKRIVRGCGADRYDSSI